MKTKVFIKYAVLFQHPRGWTYVTICDSAAKAQIYIRDQRTVRDIFKWKIVPCKVSLNLTDKVAEHFL